MSARQLMIPLDFRPGARPWCRILPRKMFQAIDTRGGFVQPAVVEVEAGLLCNGASCEPSPVSCDTLVFSSLQDRAGTLEIHPDSGGSGDYEIRAPHAVEHCPGTDERCAVDDPGFRLVDLSLFVFNSCDQTCRQSRRNRIRSDITLGDPQALAIMPICGRETQLPFLRKSVQAVPVHRGKYVPAIFFI